MVSNITRIAIKSSAKNKPKKELSKALLVMVLIWAVLLGIIYFGVSVAHYHYEIKIINYLLIALMFIVMCPFILGYTKMTMDVCLNKDVKYKSVFSKIKDHKYLKLMSLVSMALVLGLWVIGLIPVVGIFIDIAILILVVPLILMLPFSYLEHDGSFKAIVSKTVDIISGHRVRIYGMIISFIFWFLLSCLTFGLLLFYVIPYMYLSVGLLYLNFTHEKEFKKKNGLRDGYVILIFAGALVLVSAVIMFYFPKTTVWFNAILTGKMDVTGSETLSYGGMSVTYDIPNGYKISSSTDITKTYINKDNDNILQYSIYLSDVEDNLDMDKEIVNELKLSSEYKVTDKEFKLRVNGHNLKGYRYNSTNNYHATSSTVTVYYPKDSFTIAISLTNNTGKKLTEKDISKYVTVY